MKDIFKSRMITIDDEWINPVLIGQGFHHIKGIYIKHYENMALLIGFQESRWNTSDKMSFTMNCGVFVEDVTSIYLNLPTPNVIRLKDCCINTRIGLLAEDRLDKWWELQSHDDVLTVNRDIGGDISVRLRKDVIPFLNRFQEPKDVMEFLGKPRKTEEKHILSYSDSIALCYAACIASLLRKPRDMIEYIKRAVDEGQGKPSQEFILRVRDHLQNKWRDILSAS
jgi:hypothetical protein